MPPQLTILSTDASVAVDHALCNLAHFHGLQPELVSLRPESLEPLDLFHGRSHIVQVLALSHNTLIHLFNKDWFASLLDQMRFVLVYGFAATGPAAPELRWITRDAIASVTALPQGHRHVAIHSDVSYGHFSVSGRCYSDANGPATVFEHNLQCKHVQTYISINSHPYFVGIPRRSGMLFLLAEESLVDIDTHLAPKDSLRGWYAQLIAATIFLRTSCGSHCWTAPVTPANFVVDDPYLKRRYGFVQYETLLDELERTQSALTIAFIPYNYKRSDPNTIALLRRHHERFSISIHGCDHTGAEFASLDEAWLEGTASCAFQRMEEHEHRTGMPFDNVMVFPQGWFSTRAIRALKKYGYSAAVNSVAWPVDCAQAPLRIRDLLDVAITRYESFPIFVRRYPHDIFDYAFDAFFQKPIIGVEHHGYFRDGYGQFSSIVEKISALRPKPIWMTLGRAVESSCIIRKVNDDQYVLRHFASTLRFKNTSPNPITLHIEKFEHDREVDTVLVDGNRVDHETCSDAIKYSVVLGSGEDLHAIVVYRKAPATTRSVSLKFRVTTSFRRLLSEIRDNHIARNKWTLSLAEGVKRLASK